VQAEGWSEWLGGALLVADKHDAGLIPSPDPSDSISVQGFEPVTVGAEHSWHGTPEHEVFLGLRTEGEVRRG
jgi:hypothetical protein